MGSRSFTVVWYLAFPVKKRQRGMFGWRIRDSTKEPLCCFSWVHFRAGVVE